MKKQVNHPSQLCEVVRATCTEGERSGLKSVFVSNGVLNVELLENRALDVARVYYKGTNMGFLSKNGVTARKEEGFLRSFPGGMLYTCGLDAIGAIEGHALHGNLHNLPASFKEVRVDEEGATVVGEIRDSSLFGQNLLLERRIHIPTGAGRIEITDTLRHDGYREEKYCLLYHVNSGYPFLDECTTVEFEEKTVRARTPWAAEKIGEVKRFQSPVDNEEERCYFIDLKKPTVTVKNPELGKSLTISYLQETLPCLVEWKSGASGDYALGIEPCTSFLDEDFGYLKLGAGESVVFRLNLSFSDL